ncbi:MAG: c-type cytochrome [Longimicrobiales bacterium]|nr:c-type cytochrome [Longimicrobiales bacterium]
MPVRPLAILAVGVLALPACAEHAFSPPDRQAQVDQAVATFSVERYDTITWSSDEARALEGSVVWSARCRTCHGSLGQGTTEYAERQGLSVPSLVEPGWRYDNLRDSVLLRVHAGHAAGMPTWSVAGISSREIDAVTWYLLEVLRPEVIGGG